VSKKRSANPISVGGWRLDTTDLTLKHVNMGDYWVDAENLDEAELLSWVRHLSDKSGALTAQDLRDFVRLAQLVQIVDLNKLRRVIHTRNYSVLRSSLATACLRMTHNRRVERKLKTIMKQRGIGPCVALDVLTDLYEEAERGITSQGRKPTKKAE